MSRFIYWEEKFNNSSFSSLYFLCAWAFISVLQAYNTELLHDEAYYWFYSRDISWGYFDHPPVIALMIKAGYFLFENELGVRLLTIAMSTCGIFLMERIIRPINKFLFYGIICSVALFHGGSLIASPDIPLVFFSITFFLLYQKYLEKDTLLISTLLGINIALLLYSKYHGILVPLFAFMAYPAWMRKKSFWYIAVLSFILFLPHLYWQYNNDFVTFRYHLFDRSSAPYKINYTLEYLLGQLGVLGPLTSILLIIAAIRYKSSSVFHRTLKFSLFGVLIFFFLSSFKGRVEANWTSLCAVPLILIAYLHITQREKLKLIAYKLIAPSLILFFLVRIFAANEMMAGSLNLRSELHGWNSWAKDIQEQAGELPVVFINKFQFASKYAFYSGHKAHSFNVYNYSGSQYDIADTEDHLQGQKVFIVDPYTLGGKDTIYTRQGPVNYKVVDNFRSYNKLRVKIESSDLVFSAGDTVPLPFTLINTFNFPVKINQNGSLTCRWSYHFFKEGKKYHNAVMGHMEPAIITDEKEYQLDIVMPSEPGKYQFRIGIRADGLYPGRNSHYYTVEVI